MDLVVENGEHAEPGCGRGTGHRDRCEQIGGAVGASSRRATHRARHSDRTLGSNQRIKHKRGFFQGVGALDNDRSGKSLAHARVDQLCDLDEIAERERCAGHG